MLGWSDDEGGRWANVAGRTNTWGLNCFEKFMLLNTNFLTWLLIGAQLPANQKSGLKILVK